MYNYKLADIAHELDKIDINALTPIDALNILVKMKEKMGWLTQVKLYSYNITAILDLI